MNRNRFAAGLAFAGLVDVTSWQRQACQRVNRNLSTEEWQRYIGDTAYFETCPGGRPRVRR